MHYLCRKKITGKLSFLLILFSLQFIFQEVKAQNNLYQTQFEEKKLRFGFYFSAHQSSSNIEYSNFFTDRDTTISIFSPPSYGFGVGFIINIGFANQEKFRVRILPNVSFYTRNMNFKYPETVSNITYNSTILEVPILLKYKSKRRKNLRVYMIGGIAPYYMVTDKASVTGVSNLGDTQLFRSLNVEVTYGFGVDIYTRFLKFAPELRVSHGLSSAATSITNNYSRSIESIITNKVALIFNFE